MDRFAMLEVSRDARRAIRSSINLEEYVEALLQADPVLAAVIAVLADLRQAIRECATKLTRRQVAQAVAICRLAA